MFSSSSAPPRDPVVGVDVSGTLFYFHRSKLLHCGSAYFFQRLNGPWDSEVAYKDDRGRSVIFLGRSPSRFRFVRDFILSHTLHLAGTDENDFLRRGLREEALYLGMDNLLEALKVNRTFLPAQSNQGILHWLGTRRGTAPYQNPVAIGAVSVGGWVDWPLLEASHPIHTAGSAASREAFVHYRQKIPVRIEDKRDPAGCFWHIHSASRMLWCDHAIKRLPVVVDTKSVQVRPTHYSLRASSCYGMHGDWNLEASGDGTEWDVLHAARSDRHLFLVSEDHIKEKINTILMGHAMETRTDELCAQVLLGVLEQNHRHTWELNPTPVRFYRYFRIIGAGDPEKIALLEEDMNDIENEEHEHGHAPATCLHGEGFELFGDVYMV